MRRPPRLASWLMARRIWPDERDAILGDLEERFHRATRTAGPARAALQYWRDAIQLAWRLHASPPNRGPSLTGSLTRISEDVRFASRRLIKRPTASLASIVTLAAAIAAAAATWSLISSTLLRPFAVASPNELILFGLPSRGNDGRPGAPHWAHTYTFHPIVRDSGAFEGLAIGGDLSLMVATGGYAQPRSVFFASHDYFDTLGLRLALGREFTPDDDRRDAPLVTVLSNRFWREEYGAASDVLGRHLTVSGQRAVIVGVAPRGYRGLNLIEAPDLYLPLHTVAQTGPAHFNPFAESTGDSPTAWLTFVGRLPAASSEERATDQIAARLPGKMTALGVRPVFLRLATAAIPTASREAMVQFTRLLGVTVALLLLIGCLTVGMLLLLATEARRDELAMCLALGASRLRLARGVVFEGALLSAAGALLAPLLVLLLFAGLRQFQLPGQLDIELLELSIDGPVVLVAAAGAAATTVLIAVFAGAFGFTVNVTDVWRSRAGATPRTARRQTRALLVGTQVAIAFVLLAGAGLFARSLAAALELNPGFDTSRLVRGYLDLTGHGYTAERAGAFFEELRSRVQHHPAVESLAYEIPYGGMTPSGSLYVDGVARQFPSLVSYVYVDERYFSTLRQRVQQGRDFTPGDAADSPPVMIVSASFARLLAQERSPLGITIRQSGDRVEVVGVVPDVITSVTTLEPLVIYRPIAQVNPQARRRLLLRVAGNPSSAIGDVIQTLKQLDPAVMAPALSTIDDQLVRQLAPQQFGAAVMGALGVIAVILTLLGTYVLAESMTVIRRREMGIRAALGATRRQLGSSVLRESAVLVGAGLVFGLGLAWLGANTIRAFLFQVQPLDLATLATVAAMILTLALAVSLRPAINATRVDLAQLLKDA